MGYNMSDVSLKELKDIMLKDLKNPTMLKYVESMCKEPQRPIGKFNPWAWFPEITRGCNLSCWHCPVRIFPEKKFIYMQEETWIKLLQIINMVSPFSRIELGNGGEPSLHPNFSKFMRLAREIVPRSQILVYTNGVGIINGSIKYSDFFENGVNMIFVDMYSSLEIHEKLAEESGYYWFYQDEKPKNAPNIYQNHKDPNIKIIMLAENPSHWSKRKSARGAFHTFLNDLDWDVAQKYGVFPVVSPPNRRCDQTTKFVNVNYDGTYGFCCLDFLRHTAGKLGSINGGINEFFQFWVGNYMQDNRRKLYNKDRASHEYCSKCKMITIRGDISHWKDPNIFDICWDGKNWSSTEVL